MRKTFRQQLLELDMGTRIFATHFRPIGKPSYWCVCVNGINFGKGTSRYFAYKDAVKNGKAYLGQLMLIKLETENDTAN